jgi:hypothetical protein
MQVEELWERHAKLQKILQSIEESMSLSSTRIPNGSHSESQALQKELAQVAVRSGKLAELSDDSQRKISRAFQDGADALKRMEESMDIQEYHTASSAQNHAPSPMRGSEDVSGLVHNLEMRLELANSRGDSWAHRAEVLQRLLSDAQAEVETFRQRELAASFFDECFTPKKEEYPNPNRSSQKEKVDCHAENEVLYSPELDRSLQTTRQSLQQFSQDIATNFQPFQLSDSED